MQVLLAVLAIWVLFAVLGFILHVLWIVALIVLVGWLFGFAARRGQSARTGQSARWYRW